MSLYRRHADPARARELYNQALECYFEGDRWGAFKHAHLAIVRNLYWARPHWLLGLVHSVMPPIDLEEAIREYREVVLKEPLWSGGHLCLGTSLAKQGRIEEALGPLRQSVRLEPSAENRAELARCLLKRRDFREAITVLRGKPSLSPFYTMADAFVLLAETLEREGNLRDKSLEVWREILTLDETIPANRVAMVEARKRVSESLGA